MSSFVEAATAADSVSNGECDCPLPTGPSFRTYHTRPASARFTVPGAEVTGAPPPVLLTTVYVKESLVAAAAAGFAFGVYRKVPSAAMVTLPPALVAKVPGVAVTPPL